jgi:hypothetical protein
MVAHFFPKKTPFSKHPRSPPGFPASFQEADFIRLFSATAGSSGPAKADFFCICGKIRLVYSVLQWAMVG